MLRAVPGVTQVRSAHTLQDGMDAIAAMLPQLLILDIHLPDGNALDAIARLRWLSPQTEILVLSNDAGDPQRRRAQDMGADAFFDKSTEFDFVLRTVQARVLSESLKSGATVPEKK
jgi:DNA-binding NarL/FixJ family response regulator